jgi:hypothetical protein
VRVCEREREKDTERERDGVKATTHPERRRHRVSARRLCTNARRLARAFKVSAGTRVTHHRRTTRVRVRRRSRRDEWWTRSLPRRVGAAATTDAVRRTGNARPHSTRRARRRCTLFAHNRQCRRCTTRVRVQRHSRRDEWWTRSLPRRVGARARRRTRSKRRFRDLVFVCRVSVCAATRRSVDTRDVQHACARARAIGAKNGGRDPSGSGKHTFERPVSSEAQARSAASFSSRAARWVSEPLRDLTSRSRYRTFGTSYVSFAVVGLGHTSGAKLRRSGLLFAPLYN